MKLLHALFLSLVYCYAGVAHAEPNPPSDMIEFGVTDARERFRRGVELYREGGYDAALAEFNKAYELSPNYRVLYNLAQVQTERHDYVAALSLLNQYLEQGGSDVASERREQVEKDLASLKTRVAMLRIRSAVEGAELVIDSVPNGALPQKNAVLVNAGIHHLQLRKAGYETTTRVLTIAGGETVSLELAMRSERRVRGPELARDESPSEPALPPSASEDVSTDQSHSHAPLWISLIATGLLGGGAVVFGVLTKQANADLNSEFDHLPANRPQVEESRAELRRNAALTDGFAAGALIAASFSLYFALSGTSSRETAAERGTRLGVTGRTLQLRAEF